MHDRRTISHIGRSPNLFVVFRQTFLGRVADERLETNQFAHYYEPLHFQDRTVDVIDYTADGKTICTRRRNSSLATEATRWQFSDRRFLDTSQTIASKRYSSHIIMSHCTSKTEQ